MCDPFEDFSKVFFAMCKSRNTPYALGLWLQWKYRCYDTARRPDPALYDDSYSFSVDYLLYSWPSKARVNVDGRDLRKVALEGFAADEVLNAQTAKRLRAGMLHGFDRDSEQLLFKIRRKIASVLGPLDVVKCLDRCRLGGGATNTLSRKEARRDKKIVTLPLTVSPSALNYALEVIQSDPGWLRAIGIDAEGPCCIVDPAVILQTDYNVFDTVPKDLRGDRTIAKEPMMNGLLQQGVHLHLRSCLKRVGVDLRDQTQNQHWASLAHSLDLCTLDLKSASNSVTTALIELLFPVDWFLFLDCLRSRRTYIPELDITVNPAMFSSMGNAFTFEIESLIFYATLHSVCDPNQIISVYGDDLICPAHKAEAVISALTLLGFRVNKDKSFLSGRFFESCGKHYFDGTDVTPAYQKEPPRSSTAATLRSHNRLIRWAARSGSGVVLDSLVRPACDLLAREVDSKLHGPIGPEEDSWLQVPYGTYKVRHGFAVISRLVPAVKTKDGKVVKPRPRLAIQRAAYAYHLRLAHQGLPVCDSDWHSVNGCPRVTSDVLLDRLGVKLSTSLSEAPRSYDPDLVLIRKGSIPLDSVWGVQLQWVNDPPQVTNGAVAM